jgi:hypothetical protein
LLLDVIFNMVFHLQGNLLAFGMEFGTVQVWDVAAEKAVKVM